MYCTDQASRSFLLVLTRLSFYPRSRIPTTTRFQQIDALQMERNVGFKTAAISPYLDRAGEKYNTPTHTHIYIYK